MHISKKQIFIIVAILAVLAGGYYLFITNLNRPIVTERFYVNLWGTDEPSVVGPLISQYQTIRPQVTLTYTKFNPATYERDLLNALAAGQGPDVFYINSHEVLGEVGKLSPVYLTQLPAPLRDLFPNAVEQDVVFGNQVFALPLHFDTLALLYNKTLFDQAGIVYPPKTWLEFVEMIPKLKAVDGRGQIVRSAAAIGGTEKSVDAGVDLLLLLMMQNVAASGKNFSLSAVTTPPAAEAFEFYVQFSNAASAYYTWNEGFENSIESFASGKTAMLINYHAALAAIRSKNPFLNFGVAPVPQIKEPPADAINFPTYTALAVSRQSKAPLWAWDFVLLASTNELLAKTYADVSGKPPALRSLIAQKINDPNLGVFAKSALVARSWRMGDRDLAKETFNDAIESAQKGGERFSIFGRIVTRLQPTQKGIDE